MFRLTRQTALVALLAVACAGCGYNRIQSKDEAVKNALGNIQAQLQRRADLIPNLVETVKGVAKQESTIFISVAEARSKLAGAVQAGNVGEMAQANEAMKQPLARLLALVEAYPELKSNQNFRDLQSQLEGTENRISVARQDYNDVVRDYNTFIRTFPYSLTAKVFGASKPHDYFEASPGAKDAPKVKFQ
jgi:LemA protein